MFQKRFYIIFIFNYSLESLHKKSFNFLEKNLILKSQKLENEKNYYQLIINNLLPIYIETTLPINLSIKIFPTFYNKNLPFVFFHVKEGKKFVSIYNERVYNFYYIKILEEEINFLKEKVSDLKNLVNITSYEILQEIQNTEMIILKKENEQKFYKNNIKKNYETLKNNFNYENNNENLYFIVPLLSFQEKKINKYILKSYFYKKNLYDLKNDFNNYWCLGNFQFYYNNNKEKNFAIHYNINLKKYLNDLHKFKRYEFLQNVLLTNKIIHNKVNILKTLKIQEELLKIRRKNIENYSNIYQEYKNINSIISIYKKKKELIKIKKSQLENLYERVNNIFLIYLELLPLDFCKKIYEIPFIP